MYGVSLGVLFLFLDLCSRNLTVKAMWFIETVHWQKSVLESEFRIGKAKSKVFNQIAFCGFNQLFQSGKQRFINRQRQVIQSETQESRAICENSNYLIVPISSKIRSEERTFFYCILTSYVFSFFSFFLHCQQFLQKIIFSDSTKLFPE